MKKGLIYYISIVIFLLTSCQSQEKKDKRQTIPPYHQQLINWNVMNKKGWEKMSFPIWFSPEQIDSFNIENIRMEFVSYNFTDTNMQITDTLPYQLIHIDFKKGGAVKDVIIKEYSTGIEIAKNTFNYKTLPDEYGYSSPNVFSDIKYGKKNILSFVNTLQELQQYQRLVLEEKDSTLLKYLDKSSSKVIHHYFILDTTNWNVSYVDQNFKTTGNDIFYYGSPQHFVTSFSLKNLVEKTKKEECSYYPTRVLKNQYFYTDGFITKRYYEYDSLGLCMGFSDSLVTSTDEFLHLEKGVIEYDHNLPKSIGFYNEEDSLKIDPIKRIQFSYTYRK